MVYYSTVVCFLGIALILKETIFRLGHFNSWSSAVIPVYMQLCVNSDYDNITQSVWTNFPPFLLILRKTAVMSFPLRTLDATLRRFFFMAVHEKWLTLNATTDHTEILNADAQQGLVGKSRPERVQWQRMEKKKLSLWLSRRSLKKKKKKCVQ